MKYATINYETLSKSIAQSTVIITIDPGLKGAICIYWHSTKEFCVRELPLKKTQKDKTVLDLYALTGWISDKLTHNSAKTKEILVVLERPLKLSMGSLKTYTTSVLEIGKILGMLELCFLYVKRHLLFVAPITWTKGFESSCCLGISYHADVKRNRMHALIDEFGFDHKLFFTEQGRFMDGISDACAMLIWTLKCIDDFQEIQSIS